jgi:maleate isomerase
MSTRIGLIVPSSNTVMEPDLYRRLPAASTLHVGRVYLEDTTAEAEAVMLDEHLSPTIRDLATARPDVMVFGCTSAGALRGIAYEAGLIERIAAETGAETFSVAASVRRAIAARHAVRVGVITPYADDLNDKIRESFQDDGFDVVGVHGLGITENFAIAAVAPERIAAFASEAFGDGTEMDLLFASCTNFRALDARERIERDLGVPVVTSNSALLEAVLDHLAAPAGAER